MEVIQALDLVKKFERWLQLRHQYKIQIDQTRLEDSIGRFFFVDKYNLIKILLQKHIIQLHATADSYISFLKIKKMEKLVAHGMHPVRMCSPTEIDWVKEAYGRVKHHIDDATNETKWYNIWLNGRMTIQEDQFTVKFHSWILKSMEEVAGKVFHIHSYGFFFSPKADEKVSKKDQQYHLDYLPEICSIFVPLVHFTCNNATRFMKSIPNSKPTQGAHECNRFGKDDLELLEREGVDFLEVSQLICKPFMMVSLGPNTVHKGVANRGDEDRPLFFILYSNNSEYIISEDPIEYHSKKRSDNQ